MTTFRTVLFSRTIASWAAAIAALLVTGSAQSASILFVDDDEGLSGDSTWLATLTTLGHAYDYEALATDGNPTPLLSSYDIVIWSIGDRAYENLTAANVSALAAYLDGGGSLLFSGGHNLYSETNVGALASDYLGVDAYWGNMPTFTVSTTMSGTGHPVTGTGTYSVSPWSGGQFGTMMSGFEVTTAQSMLTSPAGAGGGPYVAALNAPGGFLAMTWGFDLNHLTNPSEREQLLGDSLALLAIPEPGTLPLLGLALAGIASHRARRRSRGARSR